MSSTFIIAAFWIVGEDYLTTSGGIHNIEQYPINIPKTGWKYTENGEWKEDSTIEFQYDNTSPSFIVPVPVIQEVPAEDGSVDVNVIG